MMLFLIMIAVTSCGIEGIEQFKELNPPLGLTATATNNTITLRFYSSNPEEYFSGFDIYIAGSIEELKNGSGTKMPNADFDANKPTLWENISPSSNVIIYQVTFTENHDQQPFQALDYYFFVKAFSIIYNLPSLPSNIAIATNR